MTAGCRKGSTEKWEMEMKGKDRNHRIGEIGMDMEWYMLVGRSADRGRRASKSQHPQHIL